MVVVNPAICEKTDNYRYCMQVIKEIYSLRYEIVFALQKIERTDARIKKLESWKDSKLDNKKWSTLKELIYLTQSLQKQRDAIFKDITLAPSINYNDALKILQDPTIQREIVKRLEFEGFQDISINTIAALISKNGPKELVNQLMTQIDKEYPSLSLSSEDKQKITKNLMNKQGATEKDIRQLGFGGYFSDSWNFIKGKFQNQTESVKPKANEEINANIVKLLSTKNAGLSVKNIQESLGTDITTELDDLSQSNIIERENDVIKLKLKEYIKYITTNVALFPDENATLEKIWDEFELELFVKPSKFTEEQFKRKNKELYDELPQYLKWHFKKLLSLYVVVLNTIIEKDSVRKIKTRVTEKSVGKYKRAQYQLKPLNEGELLNIRNMISWEKFLENFSVKTSYYSKVINKSSVFIGNALKEAGTQPVNKWDIKNLDPPNGYESFIPPNPDFYSEDVNIAELDIQLRKDILALFAQYKSIPFKDIITELNTELGKYFQVETPQFQRMITGVLEKMNATQEKTDRWSMTIPIIMDGMREISISYGSINGYHTNTTLNKIQNSIFKYIESAPRQRKTLREIYSKFEAYLLKYFGYKPYSRSRRDDLLERIALYVLEKMEEESLVRRYENGKQWGLTLGKMSNREKAREALFKNESTAIERAFVESILENITADGEKVKDLNKIYNKEKEFLTAQLENTRQSCRALERSIKDQKVIFDELQNRNIERISKTIIDNKKLWERVLGLRTIARIIEYTNTLSKYLRLVNTLLAEDPMQNDVAKMATYFSSREEFDAIKYVKEEKEEVDKEIKKLVEYREDWSRYLDTVKQIYNSLYSDDKNVIEKALLRIRLELKKERPPSVYGTKKTPTKDEMKEYAELINRAKKLRSKATTQKERDKIDKYIRKVQNEAQGLEELPPEKNIEKIIAENTRELRLERDQAISEKEKEEKRLNEEIQQERQLKTKLRNDNIIEQKRLKQQILVENTNTLKIEKSYLIDNVLNTINSIKNIDQNKYNLLDLQIKEIISNNTSNPEELKKQIKKIQLIQESINTLSKNSTSLTPPLTPVRNDLTIRLNNISRFTIPDSPSNYSADSNVMNLPSPPKNSPVIGRRASEPYINYSLQRDEMDTESDDNSYKFGTRRNSYYKHRTRRLRSLKKLKGTINEKKKRGRGLRSKKKTKKRRSRKRCVK